MSVWEFGMHKWNIAVVGIVVLLVSTVSCSREEASLSVAYQNRVGDALMILTAQELSDAQEMHFTKFSSGSMTAEALLSGDADVATMGDAAAVALVARYPELVTIVAIHGEGAFRHRLVSHEGGSIKRVGVAYGTSTHAALSAYMDSHADYHDIELVNLSPDLQIEALASGEIDAFAASEPTPTIALERLNGLEAIPIEIQGRTFPLALVVRKDALEHKTKLLAKLYGTLEQSAKTFESSGSPDRKSIQYLTEATGLPERVLLESLTLHAFAVRDPLSYEQEFESLAEFLKEQGKIPLIPNWNEVFTSASQAGLVQ